ncbi:MAG: 50S ribosomal protein L40e [Candidatus Aenigmarchaeota archaeon]|nr:50S ribosomal protein L40e [Candidatus Aenigmarchaeota archaeon]
MAKAKDSAAMKRMFSNVKICMKCNAKIRTNKPEKTKCRKCGSKSLRQKSKQMKAGAK